MLHILKLDNCREPSVEREGDYDALYTAVLRHGGYKGPISHYETRKHGEYPSKVEAGDTILLSGSRLDAFADDEYTNKIVEFTRAQLKRDDVRIIGVCYGHQIVARALNAEVYRAPIFELGVLPLELTAEGVEYFREFHIGQNLIQVHKDQVRSLPAGARLLATTKDCKVQSFLVPGKALCIQGHPEFTHITLEVILRGVEDKQAKERANQTFNNENNGLELGYAFARFADRAD